MIIGVSKVYTPTDNTELNSILQEIQEKIIYPAYLPEKQRKIVFSPAKKAYLEQNPIDIELEGEEYRFKAMDPSQDIRDSKLMLWDAMRHMKTKADWQNLGTLLAGYQKAGIRLKPNSIGKIVRLAAEADRIELLVDYLQQSRDTGLYLSSKEQFVRIFLAICRRVNAAEGDIDTIRHATKMADALLDIVQRPEHMKKANRGKTSTRSFLHFSAVGRTMLVHARASLAQARLQAGEPIDQDLIAIKDDLALLPSLWAPHLEDGVPLSQLPELKEMNPTVEGLEEPQRSTESRQRNTLTHPPTLSGYAYLEALAWTIRGIRAAEGLMSVEAAPLLPLIEPLKEHAGELLTTVGETRKALWLGHFEATLGSQ